MMSVYELWLVHSCIELLQFVVVILYINIPVLNNVCSILSLLVVTCIDLISLDG